MGPFPEVSLRQAREKVAEYRSILLEGRDPTAPTLTAFDIPTFKDAAHQVWDAQRSAWKNEKHAGEWIKTLERYAFPKIGRIRVNDITTAMVVSVLQPIWVSKNETASRVAQRIKKVMDWCVAKEFCGPISIEAVRAALPKVRKNVVHFRSMPWKEVPEFVATLREPNTSAKAALLFLILTASRSGEVRGMEWSEVDFDKAVWLVPAQRMKMNRPHSVPLSAEAMQVLRGQQERVGAWNALVFPNSKGKPLSDMTLTMQLRRRFGDGAPTAHGFRSSFTDWAAETTPFPREVVDASLAHQTGSKVDMAYRRTDFFEQRRSLMQAWADHCFSQSAVDTLKAAE